MNNDFKEILKRLMHAKGLQALFIEEKETDISNFDGGLRKQLFQNYQFDYVTNWIKKTEPATLFHMQDTYYLHYNLCKIFDSIAKSEDVFLIGPYLLDSDPVDYTHIVEMNHLPIYTITELQSFYGTIPLLHDLNTLESEILTLLDFYFPNETFFLNTENTVDYFNDISDTQVEYNYDKPFAISKVEKLYNDEDALLDAIRRGDYTQAFKAMHALAHYHIPKKFTNEYQNYTHYVIVHNSLFRKEAQRASVHPVYIDQLSTSFTNQIGNATNTKTLTKIYHDMLRKYCLMVRNHSLSGYSKLIQDVLNYIDFHLTEDLSLKALSNEVKSSPNYLSNQFTREVGKTLTKYVNEKRIEKSLLLLTTTDMQIQEIAEKIGINDVNYFSRLFKKTYQMTAREYRNNLKQQ